MTRHETNQIVKARARALDPYGINRDLRFMSEVEIRKLAEIERGRVIAVGVARLKRRLARGALLAFPALARKRKEAKIVSQLERLDDAILRDIGVPRCEIRERARAKAVESVNRRLAEAKQKQALGGRVASA